MHPAPRPLAADTARCPRTAPTPAASLDFTAFLDLTYPRYLRYAQARTGEAETAQEVVDDLFDHLAAIWPQVLSSSGPAAVAWRLLRSALAGRARCCCAAPAGPAHHALPPIQADSLVLHHLLGLEPQEAADLMGVRPSVMQGLITSAERAAPDCLLAHLNQNGTQRTAACGAAGSVAHHDRAPL